MVLIIILFWSLKKKYYYNKQIEETASWSGKDKDRRFDWMKSLRIMNSINTIIYRHASLSRYTKHSILLDVPKEVKLKKIYLLSNILTKWFHVLIIFFHWTLATWQSVSFGGLLSLSVSLKHRSLVSGKPFQFSVLALFIFILVTILLVRSIHWLCRWLISARDLNPRWLCLWDPSPCTTRTNEMLVQS